VILTNLGIANPGVLSDVNGMELFAEENEGVERAKDLTIFFAGARFSSKVENGSFEICTTGEGIHEDWYLTRNGKHQQIAPEPCAAHEDVISASFSGVGTWSLLVVAMRSWLAR